MDAALLEHFALPLLERLRGRGQGGRRPVIALNAPVGAGKTTLCRLLAGLAPGLDLQLAVASIDDLYLPWAERQQALAGNPFGVSRVPPGSHDPGLLCDRLDAWRAGGPLRLPRFDKTLRRGEGDRCADREEQADALLLEGWLLGCRPLGAALQPALGEVAGRLTHLELGWLPHWDRALANYLQLWQRCDELWLMHPLDWRWPRRWRFQAEARQRRQGGNTLSATALDQLVRASLCSLPPELYQQPLLVSFETPDLDRSSTSRTEGSVIPIGTAALLDQRRRLQTLLQAAPG